MIREEMWSEAKRQLWGYRKNAEIVANWDALTDPQAKRGDNMGIRGSRTSDPTARAATSRASPPKYITEAREWIAAINDAWADLAREDADDGLGGCGVHSVPLFSKR